MVTVAASWPAALALTVPRFTCAECRSRWTGSFGAKVPASSWTWLPPRISRSRRRLDGLELVAAFLFGPDDAFVVEPCSLIGFSGVLPTEHLEGDLVRRVGQLLFDEYRPPPLSGRIPWSAAGAALLARSCLPGTCSHCQRASSRLPPGRMRRDRCASHQGSLGSRACGGLPGMLYIALRYWPCCTPTCSVMLQAPPYPLGPNTLLMMPFSGTVNVVSETYANPWNGPLVLSCTVSTW